MNSLHNFITNSLWSTFGQISLYLVLIFIAVYARYLGLAAFYKYLFRKLIKPKQENKNQLYRELKWSAVSSLLASVLFLATFYLYQDGYTKIYTSLNEYSIAYFVFSIVLILFLFETYYYWLHRWMHHPKIFKVVHKTHHESTHPSVFTSFSFHPIEAILQFIFLPVMVLIIPVHYYALGIILLIMTISAIINHAGAEVYPKNFYNNFLGKWLIGSTHHDLHHSEFKTNFGLCFTFWDKLMKTESKNFKKNFNKSTSQFQ